MTLEEAVDAVVAADAAGYEPFRAAYEAWSPGGISMGEYHSLLRLAFEDLLSCESWFSAVLLDRVQLRNRDNIPLGDPRRRYEPHL